MQSRRSAPTSVDEYISGFSPEVQAIPQRVRQVVRNAAPQAREVISYRMPALRQNGVLVYFAAFKGHIGLYPPVSGDSLIQEALAPYAGEKGNLRFPFDEPIPYDLIARVAELRVKQDSAKANSAKGAAMTKSKTAPTSVSVDEHIAAIPDEDRRRDCQTLVRLLGKITKEKPRMWGPTIVGFGSYHYRYESGREGDSCLTGFAARGRELVVYLVAGGPDQEALLSKLGRHRMGKACLYIRRLSEVDMVVLEQLVSGSVAEVKRRHG